MRKSTFHIKKMDCPSEEALIRMKLGELEGIVSLDFDLDQRTLRVYHTGEVKPLSDAIASLGLGGKLFESMVAERLAKSPERDQRAVLKTVLWINLAFFAIEMTAGWLSLSMGLVADSLDMLADAFVYAISLYAVGRSVQVKKRIATTAGAFQVLLAVMGFTEVLRRFFFEVGTPRFGTMIIVSFLALLANAVCLHLLRRSSGRDEAHLKASMIFTSNDILINLGVILAGVLVFLTQSRLPDLLIGSIVFVLVTVGAFRILRLGR